jgi:hypothetical protein
MSKVNSKVRDVMAPIVQAQVKAACELRTERAMREALDSVVKWSGQSRTRCLAALCAKYPQFKQLGSL